MKQRASLCRALIHQPEVLILDEPFGALDAFTREDLWQTMHKVKAEEPFTGVLITHDLRESIFLADQVVVLSGRPARTQFVMDVPNTGLRTLDDRLTQKLNTIVPTASNVDDVDAQSNCRQLWEQVRGSGAVPGHALRSWPDEFHVGADEQSA
jgi:ABC-type nitrate/sulfonate/bicarbonate transport system ATPase subunit